LQLARGDAGQRDDFLRWKAYLHYFSIMFETFCPPNVSNSLEIDWRESMWNSSKGLLTGCGEQTCRDQIRPSGAINGDLPYGVFFHNPLSSPEPSEA
jgi:hypothetical protein